MKLLRRLKTRKGFTLVELVMVVAIMTILSAITITALNPARQFARVNNAQRRSDLNALLKAVFQYGADNRGLLPAYINSTSTQQIGSSTGNCSIACGATTTVAACVNLEPALVPIYLPAFPYDPLQSNASSTHYAIINSTTNNRLTVIACDAELGETIQNPNIITGTPTPPAPSFAATGGTITTDGLYTVHTFTTSGTFTVSSGSGNVAVLVVGGGGGGGATIGGGGGGGGLIYDSAHAVIAQAYAVTVGAGGGAGPAPYDAGLKGDNSVFSTLTAIGGGGGASYSTSPVGTGGSAGGNGAVGTRAGYTIGQGNDGGVGDGAGSYAGGGGGAGATGASATVGISSGNGGAGLAYSISGVSTYYAGGGGGGARLSAGGPAGTGGNGGGGNGRRDVDGDAGTANTGGGGGGGGYTVEKAGGAGGSGIVIIRYLTP